MAKVKFNTRILDKATGEIHEPSDTFIEVSEEFADRIKVIQSDVRHKNSFEFEKPASSTNKKSKSDD